MAGVASKKKKAATFSATVTTRWSVCSFMAVSCFAFFATDMAYLQAGWKAAQETARSRDRLGLVVSEGDLKRL